MQNSPDRELMLVCYAVPAEEFEKFNQQQKNIDIECWVSADRTTVGALVENESSQSTWQIMRNSFRRAFQQVA